MCVCVCVCLCMQAALGATMRMIYTELSLAFLLLILPLFSLPFVLLLLLLLLLLLTSSILPSLWGVHPKVNAHPKKKKEYLFLFSPHPKKKKKLIYSLYVSKILTPALTQYPRAAKHHVCQSRFHHPSVFFWKEHTEKETVGLNPASCVVVGALLFCTVLRC